MPQAQQLGRYQLLDRIAFGGMAEIYRAKTFDSEGRARTVAVKRVLQHLTTDEDFMRMLVDEAKLTAILDHPSIAKVYEFAQTGEEFFIAMEFVDGKDVRAVLEKHRQMKSQIPIEHAVWIIANVAEGLHAAHVQPDADGKPMQVVHRDVSPSNILCSYQGDAKLCDFGIAKATLSRVQTRTGVIKGKVKYMSPEQAMGRKLDGRSDLFSLGTCLYELLTLEAPFIAQTEVELIFAVRDARKRDARELRPELPRPLVDILDRVMQRQRTDRYQNGGEVARELRGFLEKNFPSYRRASLGRYLRNIFKDEIEKDLRQLESWVLSATGDASRVGVNLIADALPEDAEFKSFSPASSLSVELISSTDLPAQKTNLFRREEAPPLGDMHAQSTMITGREKPLAPRSRAELHSAATMMLDGRAADSLRAQIKAAGALHEQKTQIIDARIGRSSAKVEVESQGDDPQPEGAKTKPRRRTHDDVKVEVSNDLPQAATRVASPKSAGRELPQQPTRIAPPSSPAKPPPPPPAAPPRRARPTKDTAPDEARGFADEEHESTVPRKGKKHTKERARPRADFANDVGEGSITNPLGDSDLEEV